MDRTGDLVGRQRELSTLAATLADPTITTIVITADEGVGKSAVLRALVERAGVDAGRVARVAGDGSTAAIPFGAFAHLLPSQWAGGDGALNVIRTAADALRREVGDGPLLLAVDDAPLLDTNSAALVRYLVTSGLARAILTARSSVALVPAIEALLARPSTATFRLLPLDRAGTSELTRRLLGGPADVALLHKAWEITEGNPLLLRELTVRGRELGIVEIREGRWTVVGEIGRVPRLREIVGRRINHLTDGERDVLEVLTVLQPLGAAKLRTLCAPEAVDLVEQQQLIVREEDGRRVSMRLAHPVYGEVVRTTMSPRRTRAWEQRVADAIRSTGGRRRGDLLREAVLRLNAGLDGEPGAFVEAGHQSLETYDFALAERFARAAHASAPSVTTSLLLGEALVGLGRHDDADEAMADADSRAVNDRQRVEIAGTRSHEAFWGRDDITAALAIIDEAAALISDTAAADTLACHRAALELFSGATRDAIDTARGVRARHRADKAALVLADGVHASGLFQVGCLDEARHINERAMAQLDDIDHRTHLLARRSLSQVAGWTALYRGETEHAVAIMRAEYEASDPVLWPRGPAAFFVGNTYRWAGQLDDAVHYLEEAVDALTDVNLRRHLASCLAELAHCYALQGDLERARDTLALSERQTTRSLRYGDSFLGQARTWCAATAGDITAAIEHAWRSSRHLAAIDHVLEQAVALHDIVRLGNPRRVHAELRAIAQRVDSAVVATMAGHADAAVDRNTAGLEAAGDGFESFGMLALAAECFAAAGASNKVDALRDRVGSPFLLRDAAEADTLTTRERAIAVLAATGMPSAAIAAQLSIGVRTVNNHLQHVYGKLGVHNREELTGALKRPTTP